MSSVQDWRAELYEIADRLEAGAAQWMLTKDARDEFEAMSDAAGVLRIDAPWAALPHAEVIMDNIVPQIRQIAADLENVPEPPEEDEDA